jgi:dGTPase
MKSSCFHHLRACDKFLHRNNTEEFDTFPYRTEFGRDRDRILYSKAFRRLKGKTQVFIASGEDHVRTRLTHTLEVSQIARTVAYNLKLNGILTEAIALGHDLGHTPFGHVGERTLNQIMNGCDQIGDFQGSMKPNNKGFKHNYQGLRVVCELENLYRKKGLNLSNFALWGILNHTSKEYKRCEYVKNIDGENCFINRNPQVCNQNNSGVLELGFYDRYLQAVQINGNCNAWSFEGFLVAMADEIAQRHHDIEDGLTMKVIGLDELITKLRDEFSEFFTSYKIIDIANRKLLNILSGYKNHENVQEVLPYLSKFIVNLYTNNLIEESKKNLSGFMNSCDTFYRKDFEKIYPEIPEKHVDNIISFSEDFLKKDDSLKKFLKNRILNSFQAQQMDGKGRFIIRRLFKAYITNPRQLHDSTILAVFRNFGEEFNNNGFDYKQVIGNFRNEIDSVQNKSNHEFQIALLRAICDNIAGMTDDFAINKHKQLYE